MTNPPQSPYGPPSPHGAPPWQQPYPQQRPEMYNQPPVPYGYTAVGPSGQKQSNGPGLSPALIIGIVSVLVAFIPLVGFLSFLLGTAGIIVGIIGLVLADRPRRQAAWGTALSAASMVIAFIMFFVYTFGFLASAYGAFGEVARNLPAPEASPFTIDPVPPAGPVELATNPLPFGTMVVLGDAAGEQAYEATVTASVLNADHTITGYEGNPAPPAGMQWALVEIEIHALGDNWTSPAYDLSVEYIDANRMPHDEFTVPVVAPDVPLTSVVNLAPGEGATANVAMAIPTDATAGGQWSIYLDEIIGGDGERHFFEAE